MNINTNINALVAGNAYAAAVVDSAQASQRISTQLRVNSAKDDPVGIGMAGALKAKISSYAKAADNINSGISALNTAGTALTNIQTVLTAMRALALTNSSTSTTDATRASNQTSFATYLASIDSIANKAVYNGMSLLNGNTPTLKVQSGINAGDTTTLTFGNALSSALGTGNPLALTSLGSSTTALASGDLVINDKTVAASLSTDDTTSYASNSGSAIAKAAAINRITSLSNVVAVVGKTTVEGAAQSTSGAATGTIKINNTSITVTFLSGNDYATNRAAVVAEINKQKDLTGVTAVDNGSTARGVSLTATDGRNITVAFDGVNLTSTNTGIAAAGTYAGTYTLRALDQSSIAITSTGTLANADLALGTYTGNVAQFSTKNLGALTTAPTALSSGDLSLNERAIGATYASDDTASDTTATSSTKASSGIALAAAINRMATTTGVSAKVNSNVVTGTGFTAAAVSTIYINGQSITANMTTSSTIADVVSKINEYIGLTGVTASNNTRGITLTASDGRNISVGTNTGVGSAIGLSSMSVASNTAAGATTFVAPVTLYASSTFTVASGTNGNTNFKALGFKEGTYGGAASAIKLSGLSIATAQGGTNALTTIDDAINMVSTYQAQVGALTNVMGYQTTSNTNLTTVSTKSYGDIMNYDLAAETTALAVAQIKKNGAMAMLAQANVSQDIVTYLLKKYIS